MDENSRERQKPNRRFVGRRAITERFGRFARRSLGDFI